MAGPRLVDGEGRLFSYDRVIANPPFSLKNRGHEFAPGDSNHRFNRYGAKPPKTRGGLAFLRHMLAVTNVQGLLVVDKPVGPEPVEGPSLHGSTSSPRTDTRKVAI